MQQSIIRTGTPYPLGPSFTDGGVNFSLFSGNACAVTLVIFQHPDDAEPSLEIPLSPFENRTDQYWHIWVSGLEHGQAYGFRVDGAWLPESGQRFDPNKLLVDPYSRGIHIPKNYDRVAATVHGQDNGECSMRSVLLHEPEFDWQQTRHIQRPMLDTCIYEMHIGGFTRHPNSGLDESLRGTYLGVIEKIPYLKELGITAVELMPVQQFDQDDAPPDRKNYWGYSPINFFAIHAQYSSDGTVASAFHEFKMMVRELHKADIEVILDVVFNHTAEGGEKGPTISMKGIANEVYYLLENERQYFSNFSGCGNTCNTNNAVTRRMIRDALSYWVKEMHVDGFRFDLASVLSRDEKGRPMEEPPLLLSIDTDPALAGIKLIAEAWDAAGLYQVGDFIGERWCEWNGRFRDDVRAFWRGDKNTLRPFVQRILGSPDIYFKQHHKSHRSINFVTAHDGFTLNDLVSYSEKHNWDNGENNRDGDNHNLSANYGVEGPTDDPAISRLRLRQMKNMLACTSVAIGTPMINMGDEVCRTQRGNNNAYCQDNEISWFDWSLVEKNQEMFRFVAMLNQMRNHDQSLEWEHHSSVEAILTESEIEWLGVELHKPHWSGDSHTVALTSWMNYGMDRIYMAFNAYWEPLTFQIPESQHGWHLLIDTGAAPPNDIFAYNDSPVFEHTEHTLEARSMLLLVSNPLIKLGKR